MNVHHVHQEDDNHFTKCSHPACDVTISRMRKFYLLKTKETRVMEMYEQAVKSHDNIIKRRQSLEVSHLAVPNNMDVNYENFLNNFNLSPLASPNSKNRRYSLPIKQRANSELRPLSPRTLSTLNELVGDGNDERSGHSTPLIRCDSHPSSPSAAPSPRESNLRASRYQQRSFSMTNLSMHVQPSTPTSPHRSLRDLSASRQSLRDLSPLNDRHMKARKKLDERKQLLSSLDTDIRKVDSMLKRVAFRSLPSLMENESASFELRSRVPKHKKVRKVSSQF